ncbi:MAG: hypothetical protein ACLSED_07285 [Sellimonas intestinalis]|uniref:hypothetical protein n=1 Tax=Sellimonas intestinalis TaxID=1653434 RepID=UPI003992141D
MDPQQELFSTLLTELKNTGYDVYDGFLPPDNTPYPFVYLADSQQIDDRNKTAVFGSVYQTIDVWNNNPKKGRCFTNFAQNQRNMQSNKKNPKF